MRKKFLIIISFFTFYLYTFSFYATDYELFSEAKVLYEQNDYLTASLKFRTLQETFPSSPVVKSNYYAYYMALNYYKLGDLDKAIFYMQKSVYTPKFLQGKNYFDLDRTYYLSKFYTEKKDPVNTLYYLKRLINIDYSPEAKDYENYAFNILKDKDDKMKILYNIKYKNDFSELNIPTFSELLIVSNYFIARQEFSHAVKVLKFLYNKEPKNEEVITKYLYSLHFLKENEKILNVTKEMLTLNSFPIIFYFRGKALLDTQSFSSGIVNLKKYIYLEKKNSKIPYVSDARESILNTYLALSSYDEVINYSKEIEPLSLKENVIVIMSNFRGKNYSTSLLLANDFIKKYPNSLQAYYFSYILKKLNYKIDESSESILNEISELSTIKLTGNIIGGFIFNLNEYPIDIEKEYSNPKVRKLFEIADLKDANLINLEIDNTFFISNTPIINSFLITKILEKSKNYNLAFNNSLKNKGNFSKYKNLIPLLYPKYYKEEVESASKKYDIPEELIYTIIHVSSKFNPTYAGSMYKIGLMQVPYNPVIIKNNSILTNPAKNINAGTRKLAKYIKKNQSTFKGLIEYLYGEDTLNSIYFEGDELYLNRISNPVIKQNILNLLEVYIFYKTLYY